MNAQNKSTANKIKARMDEEANLFAMALLMPEPLVCVEVHKLQPFDLCDDKVMKKLAEKFQVPVSLMAIRVGQLWPKKI